MSARSRPARSISAVRDGQEAAEAGAAAGRVIALALTSKSPATTPQSELGKFVHEPTKKGPMFVPAEIER